MLHTCRLILALLLGVGALSAHADVQQHLRALDAVMERNAAIADSVETEIAARRTATYADAYERARALTDAYASRSLDSALVHARRALALADTPERRTRAQLALARLYNTTGVMYKEASQLYGAIDRSTWQRDSALAFEYYNLGVQLYRNLAAHSLDTALNASYLRSKAAYRDSALMLQPGNEILLANRYMDAGDYRSAITLLRSSTPDGIRERNAAIAYSVLAQAYAQQGREEDAIACLAQSALCDLENGVREYLSLQQLAGMLYEAGDYERAHRYIHRSLDDATTANAKLRMLEMADILPIIDRATEERQAQHQYILWGLVITVLVIAAGLVADISWRHRQNMRLREALRRQRDLIAELHASDHVREEWILRFMNLCLEYLAAIENYRKGLLRTAAHRDFDRLLEAVKSTRYIGKGISEFNDRFDQAFLTLFPGFVNELRALLQPGWEPNLPAEGEHLNTELRILALARLGITDGERVCKFLRCSPSTLYNYRARIRKLALSPETFDVSLMQIGKKSE